MVETVPLPDLPDPPEKKIFFLSGPLAERTRPLNDAPLRPDRAFVLCWLRAALRADENPALDVALALGARLGRPVFVYLGLSERTPYASDRLHTFQLESLRELLAALARRGLGAALHVERPGHRQRTLDPLCSQAAAIVLDEFPLGILRRWAGRLGERCDAAVLSVDTACVVPMEKVGKAHTRASSYRSATARLREERMARPWAGVPSGGAPFVPALPFEPVLAQELEGKALPALVAQCEIDHSVPPVPAIRGGTSAGEARWRAFLARGLARYAADRNDPLVDGVSRLSPWLHFGCLSPFQVAREAAAVGGAGAAKFLDELLIWRELAWSFCRFTAEPESISALPAWALRSLREHEPDPRPQPTLEQLSRARSGDPLWDACQRSLLRHGELHNNLRMTWGKALLGWTPDAATALLFLFELNHRYALDGRDPASVGGILWCLGQFDRPFSPERPVIGTVRPRPLESHAARLGVEAWAEKVGRPARSAPRAVAVIGAGLSGLLCARTLHDQGVDVRLFDKGRGPGGRLATRRAEGFAFDHGAQFFTVRDPRLGRLVESWRAQGLVAEWRPRLVEIALEESGRRVTPLQLEHPRWVAVPGMSALARHLADGLDLRAPVRVTRLERAGAQWRLWGEDADSPALELGLFDRVALALPPAQAAALLEPVPALAKTVAQVQLDPCLAVLAGFERPLELGFDAARIQGGPLSWVARNSSKPGRGPGEAWVLHAAPGWSRTFLEGTPEVQGPALLQAFAQVAGRALPAPSLVQVHRWRYAQAPAAPLGTACLFDPDTGLGACGDWCGTPRVEGAVLSGLALAGRFLES